MSSLTMGSIIGVMGIFLFMTGMPIAFALGLTAITSILLFLDPSEFELFGKLLYDATNDFGLLAIPLFVLMGNMFGGSSASQQLFAAGEAWLSKIRGGLGMSSVLACSVFAALTGSSPATSAAIGRIAIPGMQDRGYSSRIAAGAIAAGGTLGILIPPSVTLILYGIAAEVSIGQLFAAGIIPGILVTALFCVWIFFAVTRDQRRAAREPALAAVGASEAPFATSGPDTAAADSVVGTDTGPGAGAARGGYVIPDYTWGQRFTALFKVIPFIALIFAILGVLYTGIATPSEAAAVGVVLVVLLIGLVYRGLNGRQFLHVLLETTNQSTMILTITAFSAVIATVLSFLSVPQDLAQMVTEMDVNRWVIMIVINIFLLVLGLFLPPVSIIVMVTPVLYPLIVGLGFDPIWFGIIMTLNMEMGLITPPVGLNLYVLKGIAPDIPLRDILVGTLPYVGVLAVGITILSIFPGIVTWLPHQLY